MSISVTPIPRLTELTTPAFTLGTANAAGDALTSVASNSTLLAFDTSNPADVGTTAVGSATVASRRDHGHAITEQDGIVSAFCQVTAAGALISNSYNVASVTDTGTGNRSIVIDDDMANTDYCVVAISADNTPRCYTADNRAAGSIRLQCFELNSPNANVDTTSSQIVIVTR